MSIEYFRLGVRRVVPDLTWFWAEMGDPRGGQYANSGFSIVLAKGLDET